MFDGDTRRAAVDRDGLASARRLAPGRQTRRARCAGTHDDAATQATVRPMTQPWRMSVPMPKAWDEGHGPAQVGEPVHRPPRRGPDPVAEPAGHRHREQQVHTDGAQRHPQTGLYDDAKGTTIAAQPMCT